MAAVKVAVLRELSPGERRVSLVPETVSKMTREGYEVLLERGAGNPAFYTDREYEKAGASLTDRTSALQAADVLPVVNAPDSELIGSLRSGQIVVGLLGSRTDQSTVTALANAGVTAIDVALLPRTLSRAQTMDALSSQASVSGYRAAIVAAESFGRYFPMMITAAGTAKPAKVLVLGAGVAGLQAIGTAKRLGAIVTGYDVRPAARGEVESLGASFLELQSVADAAGEGGYARELTPQEQAAQQAELNEHIVTYDVVITTAQVPGRKPPVLLTADTVSRMRPGTVAIDLGSSELGGNVEGSKPGERFVTDNGVTLVGAGQLASQMATAASAAYAKNLAALMKTFVGEDGIALDLNDEILDAVVVTHEGSARKGA